MGVFVNGLNAISAQKTFDKQMFTGDTINAEINPMKLIEPDYASFIPSNQMRRMSKIVKMGVTGAMLAIKDSENEEPEGIIVGTGLGCLEDTVNFISRLINSAEEFSNPTAFIHSTHNTISAQIALNLKCYGYNSTYVHRNISFESALMDAFLQITAGDLNKILVGGIDEITKDSLVILKRLGVYKNTEQFDSAEFESPKTRGTFAGEGSFFFNLASEKSQTTYCQVQGVECISNPKGNQVKELFQELISSTGITPDLILTGNNGDAEDEKYYSAFMLDKNIPNVPFKHLSGDFFTSTGFGFSLACELLKDNKNLSKVYKNKDFSSPVNSILIYNQSKGIHHSLVLLNAC